MRKTLSATLFALIALVQAVAQTPSTLDRQSSILKKTNVDITVKGIPPVEGQDKAPDSGKNHEREKLAAKRLDTPSIDFRLRSLDGKSFKLSDLKGKVVVLDFWATWCAGCLMSLADLQVVYDKYKSNERVVILAINTKEQGGPAERELIVSKFIKLTKYTFPVLFDEGYADRYGVEGLPARFFIDREGKVQFSNKEEGSGTGRSMVERMSLRIDLLLSDRFYSSN
jgi:thiol-disulfide isomerase/thioredoxin